MHHMTTLLLAAMQATAYVSRVSGYFTTAYARIRKRFGPQRARKSLPDLIGRITRRGVTYSVFSDGRELPVLAGGAASAA